MIKIINKTFFLNTNNTSYIIDVNKHQIPITLHYGSKVEPSDNIVPLLRRNELPLEGIYSYKESNENFYLELNPLEYSVTNYDGRTSSLTLDDLKFNLVYKSHKVVKDKHPVNSVLPSYTIDSENCETLIITLWDRTLRLYIDLIYTIFEKQDVIAKQAIIRNLSAVSYRIRNVASAQLNLFADTPYEVISYNSNMVENKSDLVSNTTVYSSTNGTSCNNNSPFIMLKEKNSLNTYALAYMYSSNFYITTEITNYDILHLNVGIKNLCSRLESKKEFVTPVAIFSYSKEGRKGIHNNLTSFTTEYVENKEWKNRAKPIAFHSFNTLRYNYSEGEAKKLVKEVTKLGYEMFVLDDGWFSLRDNKDRSLGDWFVDTKKFSEGLEIFSSFVHEKGLLFGLYLSPELVSKYSLYFKENKNHLLLDSNVKITDYPTDYHLDLSKNHVQTLLIDRITNLIKLVNLDYISWDLCKVIPNNLTGADYHNYILGIYKVLREIKSRYPRLLMETNSLRTDYGMLNFVQQFSFTTTTDSYKNLTTIKGASTFFKLTSIVNTIGNKVDLITLRSMGLEDKFNLNCFGTLSYNLDLKKLNNNDMQLLKNQIELYKMRRNIFQFGNLSIIKGSSDNVTIMQVMDKNFSNGYILYFVKESNKRPYFERLRVNEISLESNYLVVAREQFFKFKVIKEALEEFDSIKFGDELFLTSKLDNDFLINSEIEAYKIKGDMLLNCGIVLNPKYLGTGLNSSTRIVTDYSSRLYEIKKL